MPTTHHLFSNGDHFKKHSYSFHAQQKSLLHMGNWQVKGWNVSSKRDQVNLSMAATALMI